MKKIFTTLIAGSFMITAGIEVKANTANTNLQSTLSCSEDRVEMNLFEISFMIMMPILLLLKPFKVQATHQI